MKTSHRVLTSIFSSIFSSIMFAAVATTMSGCVVAPAHYNYRADVVYPDAAPSPVIAYNPPPAPLVEATGEPPVQDYFWISGVWLWKGGRHVWHPGHWSAPRPGYTWVPHRWHQEGREWHMDGGHWLRSH